MSWYVTKVEVDRDGAPVRIYHRNGGAFGKVTRAWTHPPNDRDNCEVCSPPVRTPIPKPSALDELRAYQEGKR